MAIVAILTIVGIQQWGGRVGYSVRLMLAQRECMNYLLPADQVVCDAQDAFGGRKDVVYVPMPGCWTFLDPEIQRITTSTTIAFDYLNGPPFILVPLPILMHRVQCPGRDPRLVVVQFGEQSIYGKGCHVLIASTIAPASLLHTGRRLKESSAMILSGFEWSDKLRLYAGQNDPADPSHFVIRFEKNGEAGVAEGWLQSDDTVRWQIRTGNR